MNVGKVGRIGSVGSLQNKNVIYANTAIPLISDISINRGTGTATFTQAQQGTSGYSAYVPDFEGRLVGVAAGSPSFPGLRSVTNLLKYSEDFSNAAWVTANSVMTQGQTDVLGGTTAVKIVVATPSANRGIYQNIGKSGNVWSVWLKGEVGGEVVSFGAAVDESTQFVTITNTWERYSTVASGSDAYMAIYVESGSANTTVYACFAQMENLIGATNQNPSEYVKTTSTPITEWKAYANPNTVSGGGVVIDIGNRVGVYSSKGMLFEPSATNLLLQSQALATTPWVSTVGTVTTNNAGLAPDGTNTASSILAGDTLVGTKQVQQVPTLTINTTYTYSAYLKPSGYNYAYLYIEGTGVGQYQLFDLVNGTLGVFGGGTLSSTIVKLADGWCKCTMTITTGASIGGNFIYIATRKSNSIAVENSDIGMGTLAWNAQLETGPIATSPILTTTGTAARAATELSVPSTNMDGTKGSLTLEMHPLSATINGRIITCNGGMYNSILYQSGLNIASYDGTTSIISSSVYQVGTSNKVAISWGGVGRSIYMNGVLHVSGIFDGDFNAGTAIGIGSELTAGGSTPFNGYIKNIKIYNTALTDQQLIKLTI